ncbi:hypothetical protein BC831DRAFT_447912 [Entophlyctis helioformis]|nr:hypothetical protein BC831DRAFT_447912 [Entophlyctis helioformis]
MNLLLVLVVTAVSAQAQSLRPTATATHPPHTAGLSQTTVAGIARPTVVSRQAGIPGGPCGGFIIDAPSCPPGFVCYHVPGIPSDLPGICIPSTVNPGEPDSPSLPPSLTLTSPPATQTTHDSDDGDNTGGDDDDDDDDGLEGPPVGIWSASTSATLPPQTLVITLSSALNTAVVTMTSVA